MCEFLMKTRAFYFEEKMRLRPKPTGSYLRFLGRGFWLEGTYKESRINWYSQHIQYITFFL